MQAVAGSLSATPEPAAGPIEVTFAVDPDGPKHGENGLEGKCAICGQYVTKGGVLFRQKSVLCAECARRQERIGNPYQRTAGRR
ncbi:MAG: hypothetical protein FJ035_08085 [Chloroflexi bacterium]|nr:hypothetical protein [Chloroflexota bacterium]